MDTADLIAFLLELSFHVTGEVLDSDFLCWCNLYYKMYCMYLESLFHGEAWNT